MLIWIWQAARHYSSPFLITRPRAEFTPPGDFQGLILSPRTDIVDHADIGEEYARIGREFGLPANFELLPIADKMDALNARIIEHARILRFLELGAKRNTHMAFDGPLMHAAPNMQSYLDFCKFGHSPRI